MGKSNSGKRRSPAIKNKKNISFQVLQEPITKGITEEDVHKYEVAHEPSAYEELGQLPKSYGFKMVYLIARDPRWLFTYWDVDWNKYPASIMQNGEQNIFLKVFTDDGNEESIIKINPDAKNWYIPVNHARTFYYIELGYLNKNGKWKSIIRSDKTMTPSDELSGEMSEDFATVPFHLTFQRLMEMMGESIVDGERLMELLIHLYGEGQRRTFSSETILKNWSEEQKRVLWALLGNDRINSSDMGSGQMDQLLRKQLLEKLNTESASELSRKGRLAELWAPGESSLFSAAGASWSAHPFSGKREQEFYMHVNAEVIFYGGTHPNATVWIDGKEIKLNADGTFRYHFKFPDGNFEIPIVAQSPDKIEVRSAKMAFERATSRKGDVGYTSQPTQLTNPIGKKN